MGLISLLHVIIAVTAACDCDYCIGYKTGMVILF